MPKINLEADLFERVRRVAQAAGFATPEEFVIRALEKELAALEAVESDEKLTERLRGLGYIE